MANKEHLAIIRQGVEIWNVWKQTNTPDLSGVSLRRADLRIANLRGADLFGANLRRADLRGANLRGAYINWNSHDIISQLLLNAAGENIDRCMLAGYVLVSRGKCWAEFKDKLSDHPAFDWAVSTLMQYDTLKSPAPEILREAASK